VAGGLTRLELAALAAVAATAALTGVLHVADVTPVATFVLGAVALAGLAWVVSFATEAVGEHFGPAATGLLQSTLGNLPELFIVLFALSAGELVVARTSILGSLFANAFLVLGLTLVAGARATADGVMRFRARLPNDTATLLLLAVFIIVLLALSNSVGDRASRNEEAISIVGAVVLLLVYGAWLRSYVTGPRAEPAVEGEPGRERAALPISLVLLALAGVGAAFVSDWFVAALAPAVERLGISRAFTGIVIVGIAGNAVENVVGIRLAAQGKSDLAISVVKNSVAQIAVFLFPALVLLSLFFATRLTFVLPGVYVGALGLMALALWQVTGDGEASEFEGAALVGLYAIVAVLAFYE